MSHFTTASRKRIFLVLCAVLSITLQNVDVQAQVGNACSCPVPSQQTQRIAICLNSNWCEIELTYCNQVFSPPTTTVHCSGAGNAVDMYTTIYSICAVDEYGCELSCDIQTLLDAILCRINPIGFDYFGVKSSIPDCDEPDDVFCWVMAYPRCMSKQPDPECWIACEDGMGCCIKGYAFCKDPMSGNYYVTNVTDCTFGTETCNTECECDLACHDWDPRDCPQCDP
jgi:hypothetical protein